MRRKFLAMLALAAAGAGCPAIASAQVRPSALAPQSFSALVETLTPAVVNIATSQSVAAPGDSLPSFPPGSPLERFNDVFGDQSGPRRATSLGSGFVISETGHIVTNNHVIEGADDIEINFADGLVLPAEIVGRDPATDIAVLKVEAPQKLAKVAFAAGADAAKVGDWVVAIGNPLGFGGSVSVGIVSARNRNINLGLYDDFIQTDAAINRGNSGGPLFNLQGAVIGVNTAIVSPTGASVGLGFAAPAELIEPVVRQLIEFGETRRGYIGVNTQEVTRELAASFGVDRPRGALVRAVTADGPAAKAGIRVGDIITTFDGKAVLDDRGFSRAVAATAVGKTVRLDLLRQGRRQSLSVNVARLNEERPANRPPPEADRPVAGERALGMTLAELSPDQRRRFNIPQSVTGVLVVSVDGRSAAAGRISAGDVILEIGFAAVKTPAEAVEKARGWARANKDRPVPVYAFQDGNRAFYAFGAN